MHHHKEFWFSRPEEKKENVIRVKLWLKLFSTEALISKNWVYFCFQKNVTIVISLFEKGKLFAFVLIVVYIAVNLDYSNKTTQVFVSSRKKASHAIVWQLCEFPKSGCSGQSQMSDRPMPSFSLPPAFWDRFRHRQQRASFCCFRILIFS